MNRRMHNVNFSFFLAGNRSFIRKIKSFSFGLFFLFALWLIASSSAFAQVGLSHLHPNLARGSGNDKTLERYERDSINLFNGNLNISIPIGIKYPLAGEFGYQFNLTYNSSLWDLDQSSSAATAMPVRTSNAGFGWDLSFGRLIPPLSNGAQTGRWVYVSPDGAMHAFYSTLHHDLSENDPGELTSYTRDGTYYRLKLVGPDQTLVEAPDGTQTLFRLISGEWRLSQINDRFNNRLTSVIYSSPSLWMLSDNHGRIHRVYFKADPSGYYSKIIDRVELAAFNGTVATYAFTYTTSSITRPSVDNDPATSASVNLPLLASITNPDGSKHSFNYDSAGASAGLLASMQLPTMGKVEWSYQTYSYTTGANPTSLSPIFRQNIGIATRRLVNIGGNVEGTWTYTQSLQPSGSEEREMTTTVKTPLGDKTVYYFSVNTQSATAGWNRSDYGLPFTKNQSDSTGSRYLSKRVLDCDGSGNNCQPMRSTYVRYEQDQASDPASAEVTSVNRRESSNRIVYDDDVENGVARFADTDKSNFDGLGHFRQMTTNGNFGSGDVKSYFVNYDTATGSYPSTSYAMPAPAASWILNTTSQQKIIEGQSMQVTEFCYDRSTGFLRRTRRWSASNPSSGVASSNDLVTVYTPDSSGQIATEQYYGGDVQPLDAASLCTLVLPVADQYRIQHTYQYGTRNSSQFKTTSGAPFGPKVLDQQIDRNTGLSSINRDIAGIATGYEYDAMGRQIWIKPQIGHGAWKQIIYTAPSTTDSAKKTVYDKSNGGASVLTYNVDVYDSFGRVWWQQTSISGTNPNRYTFYNAMGWIIQQSEYSNGAPRYTEYLNYDPFGRSRLIRPPDGSQHDVTYQYLGARSAIRTASVGVMYYQSTGQVVESPRFKTQVFDRQGRLWKEIIQTIDGSPDVVKVNSYDVANRLTETTDANGVLIGVRLAFDGRGFLIGTTYAFGISPHQTNFDAQGHAQKQRFSLVDLTYTFDRMGRVTRVAETANPARVLKEFTYADSNAANDWRAGKLVTAKRYNRMDELGGPIGGVAVVSETFIYGGKGGRLSNYDVSLSDGLGLREQFSQSYTYTDLGKVEQIGYPNIVFLDGENVSRARSVTNTYAGGLLSSVNGALNGQSQSWANSINYHPHGLVNEVVHSNGVTDNFTNDPNGFVRLAAVSTTGVQKQSWEPDQNFYSGDFQYDGNQSLVRVGTQFFLPQAGQQPPPPAEPSGYTPSCQGGWSDPFGLPKASTPDGSCFATVLAYYTASDSLFKDEDRIANTRTWSFYDTSGRKLTEYQAGLTTGTWLWLKDYIYRGNAVLAIEEMVKGAASPKKYHFHIGFGIRGIQTDGNGFRVQPIN